MADARNPPGNPGGSAAQGGRRQRPAPERERKADERDALAAAREAMADARDALAGERDCAADERDRAADERDRAADERDRVAGERDCAADERDRVADERDRWAALTVAGPLLQRMLETIERTRAVLAADQRPQPAGASGRSGEPAGEGRGPLAGEPSAAAGRGGIGSELERGRALREQARAAIAAFAAIEDKIAQDHDDLAARRPGNAGEYLRVAEQARAAARRARAIARGHV